MKDVFSDYKKAAAALAAADLELTEALEVMNAAKQETEEAERNAERERQRRIAKLSSSVCGLPPALLRQAEEELAECRERVNGPSGSLWLRRMEEVEEKVAELRELAEEHAATAEERELEKIKMAGPSLLRACAELDDVELRAERAVDEFRRAERARDAALEALQERLSRDVDLYHPERERLARRAAVRFKAWRAQGCG